MPPDNPNLDENGNEIPWPDRLVVNDIINNRGVKTVKCPKYPEPCVDAAGNPNYIHWFYILYQKFI